MPTAPRKTPAPKVNATKNEAVHAESTETAYNEFEYQGVTYKAPADPLDFPYFEVEEAETEGEVFQAILGVEQWATFRDTRPTVRQFKQFEELVSKAVGWGEEGN